MSDPQQEIYEFLLASGADPKTSLDVAVEFARAMCKELSGALAEWEQALEALERLKTDAEPASAN